MVIISCIVNAFSEILPLKRTLVEGQQLQQKDKKKRKKKEQKKKNEKPKVVGWFIVEKTISKFWFLRMPNQKSRLNMVLVKGKNAFHVAKATLSDLKP